MKKTYTLAALVIIGTIGFAFADVGTQQVTNGITNLGGLVNTFNNQIVKSLATMFATLAMVAFFWGIVQFIWGVREGQQQVITNGKTFMGWGLVALFVMFSVWGIILFAQNVFGIQGNNTIIIPSIQLQNCTGTGCGSGNNGGLPVGGGGGAGAAYTDYNSCIASGANPATCATAFPGGAGGGNGAGATYTDYNSCVASHVEPATCAQMFPGGAGGGSVAACSSHTDVSSCSAANCTWNDVNGTCQ